MVFAGVVTFWQLVVVIAFWGLPFAVVAALPLVLLARRSSRTPSSFVFNMFAGLIGAIAGYVVGYRMYWNAHGSTEAIVYFLGGILIGGSCGIALAWIGRKIASFVAGAFTRQSSQHG